MEHRRPGQGRYARLEREQRFLVRAVPPAAARHAEIVDRYVHGTRLRLRRVEADGDIVHKLAQKVRLVDDDPESVKLTNLYLSTAEYEVLRALPGSELRKTRWKLTVGATVFAIDEFHGRHRGLVLAEVELTEQAPRVSLPVFAITDVTADDRYSGGALAFASDPDLERLPTG